MEWNGIIQHSAYTQTPSNAWNVNMWAMKVITLQFTEFFENIITIQVRYQWFQLQLEFYQKRPPCTIWKPFLIILCNETSPIGVTASSFIKYAILQRSRIWYISTKITLNGIRSKKGSEIKKGKIWTRKTEENENKKLKKWEKNRKNQKKKLEKWEKILKKWEKKLKKCEKTKKRD